ncbi:MAG TPA: cell division protein FtsQ/DivIB [Candidatus Scatomonas pullistercoris]|uniref:Cell division protein FtsQ/DivIB n=1 Tax=Candidatus Scatomonas pullistercoris TaxID=2840920 RepID=A0A9D1TAP8_9FIRM|nr:cell division protein FtsQ/DivIB [Candidatus Scatomonas pullistercoris]
MSRKKKKKRSRKTRKIILCSVLGAAAAAVLLFWGLFYIREVEVVGNTRYTAEEVEDMVISGFLDHNSVWLSVFRRQINLEDVPFMESVEVEYLNRGSVRLFVTEKHPIGYVNLNGIRYYFDQEGLVLEAVHDSETLEPGGTALAGNAEENTSSSVSSGSVSSSAERSGTDSTEEQKAEGYSPALTDLPLVTGLSVDTAAVGEKLQVEDASVFNTIQALVRMMEKYSIQPDSIEFAEDLTVTLHYGDVQVRLGADTDLEEKMTRVAAILPELEGMSGVLHLEDFTEDTPNIVFGQE